jgi:hypothetical protein
MLTTTEALRNDVELDVTPLDRVDDGMGTTKAVVKWHKARTKRRRGRR